MLTMFQVSREFGRQQYAVHWRQSRGQTVRRLFARWTSKM